MEQKPRRALRQPGEELHGRFVIEAVLGAGGQGAVYLARHKFLRDRRVALKELSLLGLEAQTASRALQQFHNEAAILASLDHPGIVRVLDYFESDGQPAFVMDYVEGTTLDKLMSPPPNLLAEDTTIQWARQICDAMSYLHNLSPPVLFRDLKPSNIMLDAAGRIRLIDFGIARRYSSQQQTETFLHGYGSAGFFPPEQVSGTTDVRSDIYALGATLYTLLTSVLPPVSILRSPLHDDLQPVRQHNPNVSPGVEQAVMDMLAIQPDDRPPSVQAAWEALGAGRLASRQLSRPVLAGREADMAWLQSRFAHLKAASLVLVAGADGMGRTRLLEDWTLSLPHDITLLKTRAVPQHAVPYGVLLSPLQETLDLLPPLSRAGFPLLRRLLRDEQARPADSSLDDMPVALKVSLHDEIRRAWTSLAGPDNPLVLVIDDLHYADVESLRLLQYLQDGPAGSPFVMIVVSISTDKVTPGSPLARFVDGSTGCTLGALSNEAIARLADSACGLAPGYALPEPVYAVLCQFGHGCPQRLVELLTNVFQEQILTLRNGLWNWDVDGWTRWFQPDNEALAPWARRLWGSLDTATEDVLKACVIGKGGFTLQELMPVSGQAEPDVLRALESLQRVHVLFEVRARHGVRYEFCIQSQRQALEALMDTTGQRDTRLGWIKALAWQIEAVPHPSADLVFRLVGFCDDNIDWASAAGVLLRAAERAQAMFGYTVALQLYIRLREHARRQNHGHELYRLTMRMCEVANLAGDYDLVLDALAVMVESAAPAERIEMLRMQARAWHYKGNATQAIRVWQLALEAQGLKVPADTLGGTLEAMSAMTRALVPGLGDRRLAESEALLETCYGIIHANYFLADPRLRNLFLYTVALVIQLARSSGRPDAQARAHFLLAYFYLLLPTSPWDKIRAHGNQSYDFLLQVDSPHLSIPILRDLAYGYSQCGLMRRAAALTDRGLRLASGVSDLNGRAWHLQLGAHMKCWLGRLPEAVAQLEECRPVVDSLRHQRLAVAVRHEMAHVYTWLGRFDEALAVLASPAPYELSTAFDTMQGEIYRGWLALHLGQSAQATVHFNAAVLAAHETRSGPLWRLYALLGLVSAAESHALPGLRLELRRCRAAGHPPALHRMLTAGIEAELAVLAGQFEVATRAYQRAINLAETNHFLKDLAWLSERRAWLHRRQGHADWRARLAEAAATWSEIGATAQAGRLRKLA